MDRDRFWEIVDSARARVDDADGVPAALVEELRGWPLAELVAFHETQEELFEELLPRLTAVFCGQDERP